MSAAHNAIFMSIKIEYQEVVTQLDKIAKQAKNQNISTKNPVSRLPIKRGLILEAAIANISNFYSLHLIVTAEEIMRIYLTEHGKNIGDKPKLFGMINTCRNEMPIKQKQYNLKIAKELHDLREQRNSFVHGVGFIRF